MRNEKGFYRKHMRFRSVMSTIGVFLMVVIMVLAFIFFWFRRYIVYTEDGLYLDIPLLNEAREKNPPQENDDIVVPIPSAPAEPTDDTPPADEAPEIRIRPRMRMLPKTRRLPWMRKCLPRILPRRRMKIRMNKIRRQTERFVAVFYCVFIPISMQKVGSKKHSSKRPPLRVGNGLARSVVSQ